MVLRISGMRLFDLDQILIPLSLIIFIQVTNSRVYLMGTESPGGE
jgi:hypothetical protein